MSIGRFSVALLMIVFTWQTAPAAEPIVIKEQLRQSYGPQQVSYPFTAGQGQCAPESVQVTGPRGPVAAQLVDVELWPGERPTVKSARLVFIVDELQPLASASYAVTYGQSAVAPVPTDLKVNATKDQVEITTAHVGARLVLGTSPAGATVALKDAPGPMLAMRLASGAWAGGSKLLGDAQVTRWGSRLTESGPVLARVVTTYTLADGNTAELTATVFAGDSAVRWDMVVNVDQPALSVEWRLPPVPGAKQVVSHQGFGQWSRADRTAAVTPGNEPLTWLSPDTSLTHALPDCSWSVKLAADGGPELRLVTRDPAAWADPVAPLTYGGHKTWNLDMIPQSWETWRRNRIPVTYAADGTVTLRASLAKGTRKWSVASGAPRVGDQLDRVKDMVLDWAADKNRPHPRLFLDGKEIEETWRRAAGDPELMKLISSNQDAGGALRLSRQPAAERDQPEVAQTVKYLSDRLSLLGNFDVMRGAIATAGQFDAIVDSDLISDQERAVIRAQMAYLAYQMADPQTWSIERGYHSGNPNMSVSYTLSLGVIACALADHPMAKTWAEYATAWQDKWLTDELGPNGEWQPEGSHYGIVSLEPMLSYAIAAKRAGFHDFTNDPRLKKYLLYYAKTHTPRDPQRAGFRATGAWGRGTSGDRLGIFGIAARMTAQGDPVFSKHMQWMWAETGYPVYVGDSRLGGFEPYYEDRRLPMEAPNWGTDYFPTLGAIMRAAFNTPHESYVNVLSNVDALRNLDVWAPGIGGISQWFGRGQPLATCFSMDTGYQVRHELLRNGVRLARNWGAPSDPKGPFGYYTETIPEAFAVLPQVDYVRSTFVNTKVDDRDWFPAVAPPAFPKVTPATEGKLEWTRQVMFLKDADPAGPAYLVLRDTTQGGQPTAWQFWTLSEWIGTPDEAMSAAAKTNAPGQTIQPARELPGGNRYTALGQFGVDVEYFVASPASTPRHTLRYGGPDNNRVPEFQDLLHLQQPGDGAYYVAVYPRPREEAAPTFTSLADGKIIKTAGRFGTDYALLALDETSAAAEGVALKGTSAAVQQRPGGSMISLGAAGEARSGEYGIAAPSAASLQVAPDRLTLTFPAESTGGDATLFAPAGWHQAESSGITLDASGGAYKLKLAPGAARLVLTKK